MTRLFKTIGAEGSRFRQQSIRPSRPSSVMRLSLLIFLPMFSLAAQDPGAAARAAIDKLSWIEGDWSGAAWYQMGPRKSNVNQTEKIYRAAGGTVLVIQGIGTISDPGAPPNTVVHDAFAVLYWDAPAQKYKFRSHIANGHTLETIAEVTGKTLQWVFDGPTGRMRYTLTLTHAGEWNEIGERSTDQGGTWTKFMEMTLRKSGR